MQGGWNLRSFKIQNYFYALIITAYSEKRLRFYLLYDRMTAQTNVQQQRKMADAAQNDTASPTELNIEWSYSGKALRAQALLFLLLSLLLVGGSVYASFVNWYGKAYLMAWCCITGCLILLWGYHYAIYFYRTYTIRYKLTERHLYAHRGLFTQVSDTTELLHIDDVQLVQTLFDRLLNGGVGSLVIFCAADKTDKKLVLTGIDKPAEIFEKINSTRTALRAKRSILTGGV